MAVYYDDDVYWHERLVLWKLSDSEWFVLTPDLDTKKKPEKRSRGRLQKYVEEAAKANPWDSVCWRRRR